MDLVKIIRHQLIYLTLNNIPYKLQFPLNSQIGVIYAQTLKMHLMA